MSNSFTSNPIKVDTPFSSPTFAQSVELPTNSELKIKEVYWYNPSNIGDLFSFTMSDGQTVLRQGRCEVANQSQVFLMYDIRIRDFTVPTLGSGTLYIYYR